MSDEQQTEQPARFLIVHADGRQYELSDLDLFIDRYLPEGFAIETNPPHGYGIPDRKAVAAKRQEQREAANAATTPPPKAGGKVKEA